MTEPLPDNRQIQERWINKIRYLGPINDVT